MSKLNLNNFYDQNTLLPVHRHIEGVPREFAQLIFPEAIEFAVQTDSLGDVPKPLVAEEAIRVAWDRLEHLAIGGLTVRLQEGISEHLPSGDSPDWQPLPDSFSHLFPKEWGVEQLKDAASHWMHACGVDGLEQHRVPGIPHCSARHTSLAADRPHLMDLRWLAISDEVENALEWTIYEYEGLGWGDLADLHRKVLQESVQRFNQHAQSHGGWHIQDDPFNYLADPDWSPPLSEGLEDLTKQLYDHIWKAANFHARTLAHAHGLREGLTKPEKAEEDTKPFAMER